MALTEEQIKNLKPGDIIDIRGFVNLPLCDGNILVELRYEFDHRTLPAYKRISTEFISLPPEKPKYDPCRLFKKGDKVRVVEWNGRKDRRDGMEATVQSNEHDCFVDIECMIKEVKAVLTYPACQLELITPIEELEPYKVWDTTFSFNVGVEDTKAVFYYGADMSTCPYTKEQAKAAAEAECKRLNKEHRKEEA